MEDSKMAEYEAKISRIMSLLTKPVLALEEEAQLIDFVNDYWQKYDIFTNDEIVPEDIWKSVGKGKVVLEEAYKLTTPGAKIITEEFTKKIESSSRSNNNKGARLVRINPNGNVLENDEEQNLDVAGFTNVLIIIAVTLVLGLILGAIIIGTK